MATQITKALAEKIAAKLKAKLEEGGAHKMAYVFHGELLVASFGIRRGSGKDSGHDHVSKSIFLSPGKAKRLGQCTMTQWVAEMIDKGHIPRQEKANPEPEVPKE